MPSAPWRLVTVDIDGTLTTVHGWLEIARRFGREPDYRALMRRFREGPTSENETIAALLEFAEGRTRTEIEDVVAATPKLDGIASGVGRLHSLGVPVALLTHNPPYITDWYRRTEGFDDAAGLAGRQPVGDVIGRGEGIRADKAGGLRQLLDRFAVPAASVVHIGDAGADAAIFPLVGGGVALNARLPEVERAADLALRTHDFGDVVAAVLGLTPRA